MLDTYLTHRDATDLGHHWLRWWLVAWRRQDITWTNVDLLSLISKVQWHDDDDDDDYDDDYDDDGDDDHHHHHQHHQHHMIYEVLCRSMIIKYQPRKNFQKLKFSGKFTKFNIIQNPLNESQIWLPLKNQ